mgnify:CR=1 FL=1
MIILDEPVSSEADVNSLGIRHGDMISIAPRCQITPNGYLKSRFIDDKGAVACCFAALKAGNNLRAAAFGMAVYCSHGMERTHIDGLRATCDLLLSYLLES